MNNTKPFFSIIIPVYNTQDELHRCIQGILKESFQDYEVLLVDDGSTDSSGMICDQYASEDARIICIHKTNGGAPDARNVGMKRASGRYLMFLDSDDTWTDMNALEEIHHILTMESEMDLLCFGTEIVDEHGNVEKVRIPVKPENGFADRSALLKHLIYTNQYFSAAYVKVIRRDVVEENSLYFNAGYLSGEDIEWSGRILLHCNQIGIYSSSFYKRIKRASGAITSSIGKKNILDIIAGIKEGIAYIDCRESDGELRAVYYEYWAYQYAMLFVLLGQLEKDADYKNILLDMQDYKWLLKYDHQKKVRMVHMLVKIIGIRNAVFILNKYYNNRFQR